MTCLHSTSVFDASESSFENISRALAELLTELCDLNDAAQQRTNTRVVTRFHSLYKPDIPMYEYLCRIHKYASCSNSCFINALIYLDRAHTLSGLLVDSLSVHRLIVTAILLAAKFYDDEVHKNKTFGLIAGFSTAELAVLELELLKALDFSLDTPLEVYCRYEHALMMRRAKQTFQCHSTNVSPTSSVHVSTISSTPTSAAPKVLYVLLSSDSTTHVTNHPLPAAPSAASSDSSDDWMSPESESGTLSYSSRSGRTTAASSPAMVDSPATHHCSTNLSLGYHS